MLLYGEIQANIATQRVRVLGAAMILLSFALQVVPPCLPILQHPSPGKPFQVSDYKGWMMGWLSFGGFLGQGICSFVNEYIDVSWYPSNCQ
jgi:hypothetical protein